MESPFPRAVPYLRNNPHHSGAYESPVHLPLHDLEELFLLVFPQYAPLEPQKAETGPSPNAILTMNGR